MKKTTLLGMCLLGMFAVAGATEVWPDGSAMDAWFADKSPVDESTLGRQYFASQMLGAKANVPELQTKPLQLTIDWIASQGGGVLVLGPGVWNTSSLFFKPGVHLKLEKGAVLKGPADGALTPKRMTRMVGLSFVYNVALVNADRCDGFTLYGEGTIDGNGRKTWEAFWPQRRKNKNFKDWTLDRPRNLYVSNSRDVRVSGVTIKDSHFWSTHFYKCVRVKIDNVRITAPGRTNPPAAPSPDAIDLDAVKDAHIWGAYMDVNDDAVCLKGGKNYGCEKLPENGGNEHILVEDCVFGPTCHSAFTCGSEAFLCRNLILRNCEMRGCGALLSLKSRPDTKQLYEHIRVENVRGWCRDTMRMRPWTQWFTLPPGVGKQETRAGNVVFRSCNVKGKENVKLDPSFMKLEGYVPPSAGGATTSTSVPSVCAEKGWKLLWSDEFDYADSKLEEKWVSENASPTHILCSRWRENAVVTNGMLRLCNRKESRGGKEWTSASVWTKARFKYGYFECRYRYAAATGTNNSFWFVTLPHGKDEGFEIDVNEGHYPSKINTNIHDYRKVFFKDGKKKHKVNPKALNLGRSVDLSKEFHVYGFLWTPDELVFYFDGKEIRRVKNEVCHSECALLLSEAIFNWAGPVSDAIDGTFMEVDYVRAYGAPEQERRK